MKTQLFASAAIAALLASVPAAAEQRPVAGSGPRTAVPSPGGPLGHGGFRRGHKRGHFPAFILIERAPPVIIEREVVREVPVVVEPPPPPPPPPPREPYVVGRSYASLPGGCMKMIEGAASYYYCGGGEWYRPVGKQYRAIARP